MPAILRSGTAPPSTETLSRLSYAAHMVGVVTACICVMAAFTVQVLIVVPLSIPFWIIGRTAGVHSTAWSKRLHPCIVDLYYRVFSTRMLIYGHMPCAERVYFMSNHQLYHDNLTVISVLAGRTPGVSGAGLRWLAKKDLLVQPLGWAMWGSGEIMLSRNIEKDRAKIERAVHNFADERVSWLVAFPEGTRKTPSKLCDSQAFCAKRGYAHLEHLLCPRVKGTQLILQEGRTEGKPPAFSAVYDVTIGYGPAPDVKHKYFRFPRAVHVHVERLPIADVPNTDTAVHEWLMARWQKKDGLLEHFQRHGSFPGASTTLHGNLSSTLFTMAYTVLATVLAMWVLKWLLHAARLALVGAHSG